ncbi:SPFH domain-containing protein [Massilia sp. S19_KUP03_FR1]|uniref:SPFH domain-containing protein n=1 Tax=Massilia sp. S19_KUP03_FR1 TaxID=3025503 RepID=UPI002FCDB391
MANAGAARGSPVLVDNRWIAGPDDLAVFFGVSALSGIFVKTLRVPATTRAYILQGDQATEVPQGEYEIEGFFTRLNHLLRDGHAEILITRTSALPVSFSFGGLATSEHLLVDARMTISVQVDNVAAFARHFMTAPGTVASAQLRELLAPSVRQLAAEFVGARSLREMAANRALRPQLDERLQAALKLRLAQFGLAVTQVDTIELRHDKFDANRDKVASLWLAADERQVQVEHARNLEQLYDDEEWQRIRRAEQDARLDKRRQELRADASIEQAELTLQSAERSQAMRAREIELYARIMDSATKKQAVERGAGEVLAELEHEMAQKSLARGDEKTQWQHLRKLAEVHMHAELALAHQDELQSRQLAQQRFAHQVLQQQIRNKIEQAGGIADAAHQRAELARLREMEVAAARREHDIEEDAYQGRRALLAAAHQARLRETERAASVEDETTAQQLGDMRRSGGQRDSLAQHEKLLRTIEADARSQRIASDIALDGDERRHAMARDSQDAVHSHDLARMQAMSAVDDATKLAMAPAPNAAVLADYLKTRVHAGMDASQLAALAQVAAAQAGVTPQEAQRMAQEAMREAGARRDAEVDKDRRHQFDLLTIQNDVNKTALTSQAQLAAGLVRRCAHGHPGLAHEQVCGVCGAPLGT